MSATPLADISAVSSRKNANNRRIRSCGHQLFYVGINYWPGAEGSLESVDSAGIGGL